MAAEDLIELFCAHLREMSRTRRTIGTYRDQLTLADKGLPFGLDAATETEIKAWVWRDGYAPATRALVHASLVAFFRWAVESGELDFDPTTKLKRPKVPENLPRVASEEHARFLVTQAPQPYRLWATLAAYAGLRCIEIWRLEREHVTERNIRVHGKGDKYAFVPTHPLVWQAVKDLPPGRLAVEAKDERAVSFRFKKWCTDQGMNAMSLHRLRGWFATSAYRATRDPRAVQRALRHGSLNNTMRYISWDEQDIQAAISSLPVFGGEDDGPDAGRPAPSASR